MKNTKRFKMILVLAMTIIAILLVTIIIQIISINNKQKIVQSQQEIITRLENEKNYYENQQGNSGEIDDKNSNSEFVIGDEK